MDKKQLKEVLKDFPKKLDLSNSDLSTATAQQPNLYFYFAQLYHKANSEASICKDKVELCTAEIHKKLKRSVLPPGVKITERLITSVAVDDPVWQGINQKMRESEYCAGVLNSACRALEHRRDMLINLGATARAELVSEIKTNKQGV